MVGCVREMHTPIASSILPLERWVSLSLKIPVISYRRIVFNEAEIMVTGKAMKGLDLRLIGGAVERIPFVRIVL